jgi:hypothetical protein
VFLAHIDEVFAAKTINNIKTNVIFEIRVDSKNEVRENTVSIVGASIISCSVIILVHKDLFPIVKIAFTFDFAQCFL